ncbi:DUF4062 domain-containing protein [bacterium]|nr:DUF4062 domain-containing protein [bacterium]
MAKQWRTQKIFISSTFRDMHSERDYLIKKVFPELRERLEPHRIHLVDIDLRWGVTEEQAENDQVLDLCLQQIDECRPFFLGILGERYGWVPTKLIDPALRQYGWIQGMTGRSITELEIVHGVLNDPVMKELSFFHFRDPALLTQIGDDAIRAQVSAEDDQSQAKLEVLKDAIRAAKLPKPPMEDYPCQYAGLRINWRLARMDLAQTERAALESVAADGIVDPDEYGALDVASQGVAAKYGTVFLTDLESFGERVRDDLWEGLCQRYPELREAAASAPEGEAEKDTAAWLAEEQDYHERFMESRLTVFEGRARNLEQLKAYAEGDAEKPCLVSGPSGSGKSALLARFVALHRQTHGEDSALPHFVGASPWSTDLRMVLRRLCLSLQEHFGTSAEITEDIPGLTVALRQILGDANQGEPLLIVLDALNQLDEANRAQELAWFPHVLPPTVKLICSCIDDPGTDSPPLNALRRREAIEIPVEPLADDERQAIIHEVPSVSAKTLDDAQVTLLLGNPATRNPLFLLVALEELRGFGSFEQLNHRIASFPAGDDATTAIFQQVIERLADDFGQQLVHRVLTCLGAARRGLSERELRDLAADVDPLDDLFPVLRQLRPYLLRRGELVDFYHRSLYKAVAETYFGGDGEEKPPERKAAHARLAVYFDAQDYFTESLVEQRARAKRLPPTPRPANIRKADELPWQRLQAEQWDELADLLMNWQFLEAKAEAQP